jgi:histone acetyltransferase (RNA polymerase elongator complex component)
MTAPDAASTVGPSLIIPIFIPHLGCPHQCVFCSQQTITGKTPRHPSAGQIQREVNRFLEYCRHRPRDAQLSFFGGNFLGLPEKSIRSLLTVGAGLVDKKKVHSIRFSTRPDTICENKLDLLAGFPVSTVELGVQSMNDRVLDLADRGHRAADTQTAVGLLKERGYQVGLQMMTGLPGDNDAGAMQTARRMASLAPDFVRIYPTLVLKDSLLADWFRSGRYRPMTLDHCVQLVKRLYLFFQSSAIPVIRMGLQASDGLSSDTGLLAGPYHPAFGHLVHAAVVFDSIKAALEKMASPPEPLAIAVHPAMVSRVQGLNKGSLSQLRQTFGLEKIHLIQDENLPVEQLVVAGQHVNLQ